MVMESQDILPIELDDDRQAAVLYSPFREKPVNPHSWNRKMKFWKTVLANTAIERNIISFDVNLLPSQFERKGMSPKCLSTVVEELKRSGQVKSVEEYERKQSWMSWGFSALVKQPLSWGIGHLLGSSKKESDIYVWSEVVKRVCDQVIELHQSSVLYETVDVLISCSELRELCQALIQQDREFNIVLSQLERDRRIFIKEIDDSTIVIKFAKKKENVVTPIRDIELQMFGIRMTQKKIEKDIEILSSSADRFVEEARKYARDGRKTMAIHSLRKKKNTLKTLDRKSGSLCLLQDLVQKIEDSSTNEMVTKACEAGVAAMKTLSAELNMDRVESVMDDVQEAMDNQDDISELMSSRLTLDNDDDLELELKDLISGEEAGKEDNFTLPDVPSHSPRESTHRDEEVRSKLSGSVALPS